MRGMLMIFLCTRLSGILTHARGLSFAKHASYKIRVARAADLKGIDECNRANLQENYSRDFFEFQLNRWPELSLVVENDKNELMGYALGRLEEVPCEHAALPFLKYDQQPQQPPQFMGHVVSVALYPRFRGLGAAQALMNKLHFSMAEHYHVDAVNLFCRTSNIGAMRLYGDALKYRVDRTVTQYYLDKEDAHLMTLHGLLGLWQKQQEQHVQKAQFNQQVESGAAVTTTSSDLGTATAPTSQHSAAVPEVHSHSHEQSRGVIVEGAPGRMRAARMGEETKLLQ